MHHVQWLLIPITTIQWIINMKILITGGPVHAYLDAVKIITNKFKGGLMAELADKFKFQPDGAGVEITYLTRSTNNILFSVYEYIYTRCAK